MARVAAVDPSLLPTKTWGLWVKKEVTLDSKGRVETEEASKPDGLGLTPALLSKPGPETVSGFLSSCFTSLSGCRGVSVTASSDSVSFLRMQWPNPRTVLTLWGTQNCSYAC